MTKIDTVIEDSFAFEYEARTKGGLCVLAVEREIDDAAGYDVLIRRGASPLWCNWVGVEQAGAGCNDVQREVTRVMNYALSLWGKK